MSPENFAYWLQGFVELTQGQTPNPAQWKSIQEHLATVFKKMTPPVGEVAVDVKVDTKDAQKSVESLTEAMRRYFEVQKQTTGLPPFDWTRTTVTC